MKSFPIILSAALALLAFSASATNGVLDQVSPYSGAWFYTTDTANVWQQQVRTGVRGRLEAFQLYIRGIPGAELHVRVRVGDGWNVGPVAWEIVYTNLLDYWEPTVFHPELDHWFEVGDTFVIEVQGADGIESDIRGNYVNPVNPPQYPEELYLSGPGCYANCGYRLAFRTWMDDNIATSYCVESMNSTGEAGLIKALGSASIAANDLQLEMVGGPAGQLGTFFYGPTVTFLPAADGYLCVGTGSTGLARLAASVIGPDGRMVAALDNTAPPSPATQLTAGSTWYFQANYRDPNGGPVGVNFSDAIQLNFLP